MKRSNLECASDRAQKKRRAGVVRIGLEQMLFWPDNRGGMGVSGHHLHEVAWDCLANQTKVQRYNHVDLIEIAPDKLTEWVDANSARCNSDPFMPRCASNPKYVCVSKTHFVHAHKLAKDGSRCLFNKGTHPIRWQETDTEGKQILDQGPLCAIYDLELCNDPNAMNALTSEDNLNQAVQMGEDEMTALGRVSAIFDRTAPSQDDPHAIDKLLAVLEMTGLGKLSPTEWKQIIRLRSSLSNGIATVLQSCQFHICAGQTRVKPADFGLVADLDPRAPWAKVCILLGQYIGSMPRDTEIIVATWAGRKEITAKMLQRDVMTQLVAEVDFVMAVANVLVSGGADGAKFFDITRK